MQFVYKPEGAEPRVWPFKPNKLMNPEAEAIEKMTKMTFGEWQDALERNSVLAIHGLLYVMLKREVPTLKWEEVQFCLEDVAIEYTDEEKVDIRDEFLKAAETRTLDDDERAMLDALVEELGMPASATDPDNEAGPDAEQDAEAAEVPKAD